MAIIDPHKVFENGENVDLSKLDFFVDLKVYKRNRLSTVNNSDDTVVISLLGGSPNNTFTTDWTENKENFGITSINVKVNSSYVPQVDITFEDIRGQSLFNDFENSKYKILFDMPPPIFELTLKGYYGQAIVYRLHLLKINTKFKSNGSFVITANFVGMTFAPLSDLLFDYLLVAPYLVDDNLLTGDVDTTFELKQTAQQLVSIIKTATDEDRKFINDKSSIKSQLDELITSNSFIKEFTDSLNTVDTNTGNDKGIIVSSKGNVVTIQLKYYYQTNKFINRGKTDEDKQKANNLYKSLITELATLKDKFFTSRTLDAPKSYPNLPDFDSLGIFNLSVDTNITKAIIDFGDINQQFIRKSQDLSEDIKNRSNITNAKVESIVFDKIKGGPTLSNVLKIFMSDAKRFYSLLSDVVKNAQEHRKGDEDTSTGDAHKYAFPEFLSINENNQRVKTIPSDETWDEVIFVNKYINAKLREGAKENSDVNYQKDSDGNYKYVPISPFDSPIYSNNIYNKANIDNIFDIVLNRGNVFIKETFANQNVNNKTTNNVIISYAKNEAYNIIQTLSYNDVLKWFINKLKSNKIQTYPTDFNNQLKLPFYQITEASISANNNFNFNFNGTYSGGLNYDVLSIDDFNNIDGGIPRYRNAITGSNNDLITKTESEISNLNNYFLSLFGLGNTQSLCQYNVPFFQDKSALQNRDNENYSSDYTSSLNLGTGGITFSSQFLTVSGHTGEGKADEFLNHIVGIDLKLCLIKNPFEIDTFKQIGGIHEIPLFVLAWWGYVSKNYKINSNFFINIESVGSGESYIKFWNQIPIDLQTKFSIVYDKYVEIYNAHYSELDLLIKQDTSFFNIKDGFFSSIIENEYLILGDTILFNSDKRNKLIDFSEPYDLYDNYFNTLSREILNQEPSLIKADKEAQQAVNVALNDGDVRSELYYNFKSFVDRWMLGGSFFDYSDLFDVDKTFLMVDRAFNNIGDKVILDLTPLWDSGTSSDTSLYTLILNILTRNNFEFFALPTYIDFKNQESGGLLWSDANVDKIFGTYTNVPIAANPKFVCMYVGGTSAQLDIGTINPDSTSHGDDGGSISSNTPGSDIPDISNSESVTAFRVDYGSNNQSFFKDIELDQMEFKETNESILLLDKISKTQNMKDVTQTKSNSLFNVYQQRSYTCSLEILGNMMIQPTMYFDLTNIAMFKGAYLILEVNHSITANSIKTKFKGVRVPKYMKPYVTKYSMIVNLDIGYGSDINTVNSSLGTNSGGITKAAVRDVKSVINKLGAVTNPALPKTSDNNIKKALLDVISYAEGTMGAGNNNGYDILVGGSPIPAYTLNYSLPHNGNPTFADLKGSWFNRNQNSSAAGRYQINYETWLINNKNNPFNSVNQDNRALSYITERFDKYGLDLTKINQSNFIKYIDSIANVWASLPYNNTINVPPKNPNWSLGSGFYPGQGGKHTVDELWLVFDLSLKKYNGIYKETDLSTDVASILTPEQQIKINSLHPAYQDKFKNLVIQVQKNTGYQVLIGDTYRNLSSQSVQYSADTRNAPVGQSLHNYGLAFDINLIKNGVSLLKSDSTSAWQTTGAIDIAKNNGFAWGGEFTGYKDNVHFEVLQNNGQRFSGSNLLLQAKELFGTNLNNFDGTKLKV